MKSQIAHRSKWAASMAFVLIFAVAGCNGTGQVIVPTVLPEASPTAGPEPASPTSEAAASPPPASAEPAATSESSSDQNTLYQDDFTNKGTGWPEADFGDYFIGYHEPEYYHIEIKTAHAKAPVVSLPDPDNNAYPDATIELQVFTVAGRTATEGDYRYGLVFRRSGDNYYAFTISPTSKKWEVLKSSPSGQVTLKEGTDENIQGLDVDDLLRVDAQGSSFLLSINGQLVGQVTDSDYSEGEIGLYAENLENSTTHVHFNTLTVREVKFTLMCNIDEGATIYVRSGPGKTYPQIAILSSGDTVQANGISSNQWIQIVVEGSNELGWVSWSDPNIKRVLSCTPSVDLFPVISP